MEDQAVPKPPAAKPPAKGRARWLEVLAGLAGLAVLAFFLLMWGIEGAVHNRKVQTVPDLKGQSVAAALESLSSLNLALRKEASEFDASVPPGAILRQNPEPGTKVREGKVVRVVLSQGGETVFVPGLAGLPLRNAEMMLRQSQLHLGEVTESYSLRMAKGMVLSQAPKVEASVERGSAVSVVISGGQPPPGIMLMPDFSAKDVAEAEAWASEHGARLSVDKDMGSSEAYGTVLSQEPAPDTVLGPRPRASVKVSGKAGGGRPGRITVHYEVPQGSSSSQVRMVLVSPRGEQTVFDEKRAPGTKLDVEVPASGAGGARLKIFLNGVLVEEKNL